MKSLPSHKQFFLGFLMMLCMISMFSTDIFLPAFPAIKAALNVSQGQSQLMVTSFFLGLALSQILSGSGSDFYGRRRVLLFALSLYTLGSLGCALSFNLMSLIISRFVQGFGAGAIVVLWRAIAVDSFDKDNAIKVIATVAPAIIVSPAIAPLIGGFLFSYFGWRSTFSFLMLLGMICFAITYYGLPETLKSRPKDKSLSIGFQIYFNLMKSPVFLLYTLIVCGVYGAYFAFISQSPFIFSSANYSVIQISLFYLPITMVFLIGNFFTKKIMLAMSSQKVLLIGIFFFTIGTLLIFAVTTVYQFNSFTNTMPAFLVMVLGNSILLTFGISKAVTSYPQYAGSASGLISFSQSIAACIMTAMVAYFNESNLSRYSLSTPILLACITIVFAFLFIYSLEKSNGVNTVEVDS